MLESEEEVAQLPFCPECRFEYIADVEKCPDCGVQLVAELPAERPPSDEDFTQVALCEVNGEIHAKMLQDVLASKGIPSCLKSKWPFGWFDGLTPPSPLGGGTKTPLHIMVNRHDLQRAQVIYRDFEQASDTPAGDASADSE